jgi:hypothetical protein
VETGSGAAEPLTVDVDPAAAARGTTRQLWIPAEDGPDHRVLTVVVPPGTPDGAMLPVPGVPGGIVRVRVTTAAPGVAPPAQTAWVRPERAAYAPAPRRRGRVVPVVVAVLLLLGVGATVLATRGGDDDPGAAAARTPAATTSGPASSAPVTTAPEGPKTPAGASPTTYQRALSAFDLVLAQRLGTLRAARTPTRVSSAAHALSLAIAAQQRSLAALAPPAAVKAAHDTLIGAVDQLATDAESVQTQADEHVFCTGPAAAAWLSRAPSARDMRTAAYQVSRLDRTHPYKFGASLPRPRPDQHRRLGRGAVISRSTSGLGTLTVDNGSSSDTVINVVRRGAHRPSLSVYSPARSKFTVGNIGDGNYDLFLASGSDWDGAQSTFTHNCAYEKFDQPFPYTTAANTYTTWSVSLEEVIDGNATKSDVDPDSFPHN